MSWTEDKRLELIDGVVYDMSPAPSQRHQEISGEIFRQLANFLQGKPCKPFVAPFDVRLSAEQNDDTVVQSDVLVVCDKSKLDGKSVMGAQDFIIEVLLPSTARNDKVTKYGRYYTTAYDDTKPAPVTVLEGCDIDLEGVFAE